MAPPWRPPLYSACYKAAKTLNGPHGNRNSLRSGSLDRGVPRGYHITPDGDPGALDVKADVFIDRVIARTYDGDGQSYLRQQIKDFNAKSTGRFGKAFHELDEDQREELLRDEEKSNAKFNPGVWGKTVGDQAEVGFYRSMKSMAIWAYMTSEKVGEEVLSYLPVPGTYEGCVPVSEVGNKWSLG